MDMSSKIIPVIQILDTKKAETTLRLFCHLSYMDGIKNEKMLKVTLSSLIAAPQVRHKAPTINILKSHHHLDPIIIRPALRS